MKAFLFAAGVGSRLKPFTDKHPKALATVAGKSLLERNLDKLANLHFIDGIVVNVHHFSDQIIDFIGSHLSKYSKPIYISDETDCLLDTGGGLLKGTRNFNGEGVLVHNVDILTDIDLTRVYDFHRQSHNDVTLLVMDRDSSRKFLFDNSHSLKGWRNSSTGETIPGDAETSSLTPFAFSGIHLLSPDALKGLKDYSENIGTNRFSIVAYYLEAMKDLKIHGYIPDSTDRWIDVGRPQSLEMAQTLFAND